MASELVFAPLGGVGEIGMNLSIYGVGDGPRRKWLIVDCGVSFAAEEHLPGVDLILPDIRYLIEERRNIVGLVLTHGHEDHMGALIDFGRASMCRSMPRRLRPRCSRPAACPSRARPKFRSMSCRSAAGWRSTRSRSS